MITDMGYKFPVDILQQECNDILKDVTDDQYDDYRGPYFKQYTIYKNNEFVVDVSGTIIELVTNRISSQHFIEYACLRYMYPGTSCEMHVDDIDGIHLAVSGTDGVEYDFNGTIMHMAHGCVYYFNSKVLHRVVHNGLENRLNYHIWIKERDVDRVAPV